MSMTQEQEENIQDTSPQLAVVAARPILKERELNTLSNKETLIATIAHEFVEKNLEVAIMRFVDIRSCVPRMSVAYKDTPPPLACWRAIFELVNTHLAHVLVAEREIAFEVEFLFVEENPTVREEAMRHAVHWHTPSRLRAVQEKESELV